MSSEWYIRCFADAPLTIIDGDRGVNYPKQHEFSEAGDCLFLNAGNVTKDGFSFSDCAFITREKDALLRKGKLTRGDVVLTTRGTVGNVGYYSDDVSHSDIRINSGMVVVRPNPNEILPRYLYFFLRSKIFREQVASLVSGSAQPQLPIRDLNRVELPIPPLDEQGNICEFLGALDDRIALLRETNATLEAIAQALFKSWFVDFDPVRAKMEGRAPEGMDEATAALFPDSFEETELGEVPRGWHAAAFGEILELTKGCSYKGEGLSEFDGAYMFNLGCFNAHRVFATEKVKRYTGDYKPRHSVVAGDLIIANTDMTQSREILGRPIFVPDGMTPGFISHHVFKVNVKAENTKQAEALRYFIFFALQQSSFRERAIGFATGTTVLALPAAAVQGSPICLPAEKILDKFSEVVQPIFQRIRENEKQAEIFSETRDTLLPRLISGQLLLPEAKSN